MTRRRPRILYFAWADSSHTHRWASGMASRGFDIEVLSVGGEPIDSIPTTIFPYTSRLVYPKTFFKARESVRRMNPDFVHIHSASGYSLWSLGLGNRERMMSVWGSDILKSAQGGIGKLLIGQALGRAKRLTATSQYLASETVRLYPSLEDKIRVIPFGVDLSDQFPPFPNLQALKLCMLTSYRPLYGGELAIEAVALLRQTGLQVTLSLLYPGEMKSAYEKQAARLGIGDSIHLFDPIPHAEVGNFIARHHLLLRPSHSDSFGVAILEAAALGRPSIASKVGGLPEVIGDGKTGMLFAPNSARELAAAIRTLYESPSQLVEMGKNARKFVEDKYAWSTSLDLMAHEYNEMLADRGEYR